MKRRILCIGKILLSVIAFPLWFIKMFKDVGHLPDQETGEIIEIVFRHSMFENICAVSHPILAYISMAVIIVSVVFNVILFKYPDGKKLKTIGNTVFGIAIGLFIVLLLFASTVARGY